MEPTIDGDVLLRSAIEGVPGPLVVEPEERVFRNAVRDDDRRHLIPGVCGPVEDACVHDNGTDLRYVDMSSGEVELVRWGARRIKHREGECLEVGGDGSIEAIRAEGKVNAADTTVWGLGDGADESGLQELECKEVSDRAGETHSHWPH